MEVESPSALGNQSRSGYPSVNSTDSCKAVLRRRLHDVSFGQRYLTADQLRLLAEEAGKYRSLVLLLCTAGLRWGEAAALRVRDIDFLRHRVELHRNAVTVSTRTIVGTLKSGQNRTLALAAFVVEELAATCQGKRPDALIRLSQTGGYMGPPSSRDSWRPARWSGVRESTRRFRV